MKKILFALTAFAVLMTSCSKEFINPRHNSSEPLDEYFNTPERLFQCLVAAYDPLEWYDYAFGQYDNLHLIFDVMGDDVYAGGSNEGDQPIIVKTHYYTALPPRPMSATRCGRSTIPASTAPPPSSNT